MERRRNLFEGPTVSWGGGLLPDEVEELLDFDSITGGNNAGVTSLSEL